MTEPVLHTLAVNDSEDASGEVAPTGSGRDFHLRLDNFEGPFDLLLNLIGRRQLDVTEVALSQVTDEFLSHLQGLKRWDLGQATEFLVVAATLLDLKAARLLPAAEVEDEEDLALLEARDLLFARLLQYRAYKLAAAYLAELERAQHRRHGRSAELEPRFVNLLPDLDIGVDPRRLAAIASAALAPKPVPTVATEHVHAPVVSVVEHMAELRRRLHRQGAATFRALVTDCGSTLEVVARFLGLLELYREGVVAFDQVAALAELRVRWTGSDRTAGSAGAADEDPGSADAEDAGRIEQPSTDEIAEPAADPRFAEPATEPATEPVPEPRLTDADKLPAVLAARLADPAELAGALEAVLFIQDAPLSVAALAAGLQQTTDAIETALDGLRDRYAEHRAGIELREVAGGVRLYTRAEHADTVEHFLQDGQRSRLSQAALETLAVIAYRQPVTRARVSAIRGVNVDGVVRTLMARGLIVEVGADPDTGGGLFRTTDLFLERMGLSSLDELPSLAPLLPGVDSIDALATDEL
jgi:segregation and condensation protein A